MYRDVQRRSSKLSTSPIASQTCIGILLVVVVSYTLFAPGIVRARATSADDGARIPAAHVDVPTMPATVRSLVDTQASVAVSPSFAPIDPPAPYIPPPLREAGDDLVVELSANGKVLLHGAASVSKATSAITSTVRVDAGNVRINPDITSAIVGSVHSGDVLNVLGVSDGWYLVSLTDQAAATSSITGEVAWVSEILIDAPDRSPTLAASSASSYRWLAATDPTTIYDTGGVLHLRITDAQSRSAVSSSVVGRASELAPAKEISFTLTLHWAKGHAPGGSIFHTMLGDGRDLQMRVGPGEGYPWAEFALDDQLLPDSGTGFPLYAPTPVQFVWNGSEVVASIGGEERARVPVTIPMTSLRIAIEAEPGCIFHLTVGDMTIVSN